MYSKNGQYYAEAGHLLVSGSCCGYSKPQGRECTEIEATADDLTVTGGVASWAGGRCAMRIAQGETYASIKARLVKLRYSNDDQIAVMLNGDPDELQRMQQWREWAAEVAHRIVKCENP